MLDRDNILATIPHQGLSCLLDAATYWDDKHLEAITSCHNDPVNPYRLGDRLPPVIGVEIAMQAAALHGALTTNIVRQGWLASVRDVKINCDRLDIAKWEKLIITISQDHYAPNGMIYSFVLKTPSAARILSGTGTIMLPLS